MEKDIQDIIRAAAERYGLGYDLNSEYPTVLQSDGSIKVLKNEDISSIFSLAPTNQGWTKITEEMNWSSNNFKFKLGEHLSFERKISSAA